MVGQLTGLDGCQRQEGRPSLPIFLEEGNGSLGMAFFFDNDVLTGCPKSDFHGGLVARLKAYVFTDRPNNAPNLIGSLQDRLDTSVEIGMVLYNRL